MKNKTEEIGTEYLYIDGLILVFKGIENMETFPRKIAHLIDRIDALVCFKYLKKMNHTGVKNDVHVSASYIPSYTISKISIGKKYGTKGLGKFNRRK